MKKRGLPFKSRFRRFVSIKLNAMKKSRTKVIYNYGGSASVALLLTTASVLMALLITISLP